jgi:hypothetical protein
LTHQTVLQQHDTKYLTLQMNKATYVPICTGPIVSKGLLYGIRATLDCTTQLPVRILFYEKVIGLPFDRPGTLVQGSYIVPSGMSFFLEPAFMLQNI